MVCVYVRGKESMCQGKEHFMLLLFLFGIWNLYGWLSTWMCRALTSSASMVFYRCVPPTAICYFFSSCELGLKLELSLRNKDKLGLTARAIMWCVSTSVSIWSVLIPWIFLLLLLLLEMQRQKHINMQMHAISEDKCILILISHDQNLSNCSDLSKKS